MVVIVPAVEGLPPRSMQDFILVVSEVSLFTPGANCAGSSYRLPDLRRDKPRLATLFRSV